MRSPSIATFCLAAVVALASCSGPSDGDGDDATPLTTSTAAPAPSVPALPTATSPGPTPTATVTATAAPSPTATQPAPTATATPTVVVPTVTPAPTATLVPLPSGGAELRILGKAVRQIVAADAEGSVLYAVTGVGLSRSRDGGRTWSAAGDAQVGTPAVALNDFEVLYSGAKASCGFGVSRAPLTRSLDGGATWETVAEESGIQPLLVEAGEAAKLVGTDCTLQLSNDGGETWRFVPFTSGFDVSAAATNHPALDGEVVFVGTSEGGTGILWKIDVSAFDQPTLVGELARFYGRGTVAWTGERMVLATATGVGVSDDGGVTWRWSRVGLETVTYSVDPLVEEIPEAEQGQPFEFSVARIDPHDPNRIWVAGQLGAYRSDDGGQTWQQLGDESSIDSLVVSATVDRVYLSSDGGTRAWTLAGE